MPEASIKPEPRRDDWTGGAAKWAAVGVLGLASITGMAWSIFGRDHANGMVSGVVGASAPPPKGVAEVLAPKRREPLTKERPPAEHGIPINTMEVAGSVGVARLININTATAAELELLPAIGPALAAQIIAHRDANGPFTSVDDLDAVSGIGERTLGKLRPLVTVE